MTCRGDGRSAASVWIRSCRAIPAPEVRLLCIPYAGGAAQIFEPLASALPTSVEVLAVQLPGRHDRFREAAIDEMERLVSQLVDSAAPLFDRPYALYGHSMGALVAFELARRVRAAGLPAPRLIAVGAHPAPQLPRRRPPLHLLPNPELIEALTRLGGIATDCLQQPELLQLILPCLRADLKLAETYVYSPGDPLECPILGLSGEGDPTVPADAVAGWAQQTRGAFLLRAVPGGHFFLHEGRDVLVRDLVSALVLTANSPADRSRAGGLHSETHSADPAANRRWVS